MAEEINVEADSIDPAMVEASKSISKVALNAVADLIEKMSITTDSKEARQVAEKVIADICQYLRAAADAE